MGAVGDGISLATVRVVEEKAGGGGGHKNEDDDVDDGKDDEDEEDEERAALLVSTLTSGGLGDGDGAGGTSSSAVVLGRRWRRDLERLLGVLVTVKGECVMFVATFIYALQNVVAKTVERRVPPLQVVFIRSLISGAVTCYTIYHRTHAHNRKVAKNKNENRDVDVDEGAPQPLTFERFLGDRAIWHLCLVRGVSGSIAFSFAYVGLTYLTVGDSVAIFFLNPIFSALLAWPVLGRNVVVSRVIPFHPRVGASTERRYRTATGMD